MIWHESDAICLLFFRTLLIQDYGFLQRINIWPPFVTIGICCASLSAAMCSMIGASRILHALALDHLFGQAWGFYTSQQRLLCVLSHFFLRDFCFSHRFTVSPRCHHIELGESVDGSALHLGSGAGERSFCSVQSIFSTSITWCHNLCVCVTVCGVCRPAQCCSKFGDGFLFARLCCRRSGVFGSRVGVSTEFQVIRENK